MSNLEPIDEKDLDLKDKFGALVEKKENISAGQPKLAEQPEFARETVVAEKDNAYTKILSQVQGSQNPTDPQTVKTDATAVAQKIDAESQIQHLTEIALQKGVVHAVKVARHLEDNFVLDSFHDKLLSDELHSALLAKGLIKEI